MATMTMQAPGMISGPDLVKQAKVANGKRRRTGLIPMAVGATFEVNITGNPEQLTAKDRRLYSDAKGVYFCTGCAKPHDAPYRMFETEKALRDGHPAPAVMDQRNEVHVFGFWSNDAINPPEPTCEKCIGEKGKPPKACADHGGGALGLLTPEDPHAS